VVEAATFAPHGGLGFFEDPEKEPWKFPKFTYAEIENFVKGTIRGENASDTWDEGSFVAVMLSLFAPTTV